MTTVANVQSAAAVNVAALSAGQDSLLGNSSLLPEPAALSGDPLMALLILESKSRELQKECDVKDVKYNIKQKKVAFEKFKKALEKARKKKKKGGFWKGVSKFCHKLGKLGSVVAATAVVVGTGGVGAVGVLAIAGMVMSSASVLQDETQFMQKMGMSDSFAATLNLGLTIGGAICSGGAAGAANAGAAVETVQKGVSLTSSASTMAGGVADIQSGKYEAAALKHEADAKKENLQEQHLMRVFEELLDEIENHAQQEQRAVSRIGEIIQIRDATPLIVARRV